MVTQTIKGTSDGMSHDGLSGQSCISSEELEFLVDHIPVSGRYAEIGVASAVTAARIAMKRPNAKVLCIDPLTAHCEGFEPENNRIADWRKNKQPNMGFWYGTTTELLEFFSPTLSFDIVFVDPDHNFTCTHKCLYEASCLIGSDGIIAAHDWHEPRWPEVTTAIKVFCTGSEFKIRESFERIAILRQS